MIPIIGGHLVGRGYFAEADVMPWGSRCACERSFGCVHGGRTRGTKLSQTMLQSRRRDGLAKRA